MNAASLFRRVFGLRAPHELDLDDAPIKQAFSDARAEFRAAKHQLDHASMQQIGNEPVITATLQGALEAIERRKRQ